MGKIRTLIRLVKNLGQLPEIRERLSRIEPALDGLPHRIATLETRIDQISYALEAKHDVHEKQLAATHQMLAELTDVAHRSQVLAADQAETIIHRVEELTVGQVESMIHRVERLAVGQAESVIHRVEEFGATLVSKCITEQGEARQVQQTKTELQVCRAISDRCIFVIGPARSGTTILGQMINTSREALVLSEANWFMSSSQVRFRDWYNEQRALSGDQASKLSHAPEFDPDSDGSWFEWLAAASRHFPRVGEKIALSSFHLNMAAPEDIRRFFEARFFSARYVFTLRHPLSTLQSIRHMFHLDDAALRIEIVAWLKVVQMWADMVRTFPRTFTVIADDLSAELVPRLSGFLELDLDGAERLLDPEERRAHAAPAEGTVLARFADELSLVFDDVRRGLSTDPILWQADQKRALDLNDTRNKPEIGFSMSPQPLGQAWSRAAALIRTLQAIQPNVTDDLRPTSG